MPPSKSHYVRTEPLMSAADCALYMVLKAAGTNPEIGFQTGFSGKRVREIAPGKAGPKP